MKFELSVPYCLHNKVCVLENSEKRVRFGLVDEKNQKLKNQLENSVRRFYQIGEKNIFDFCRFEKIGEDELKNMSRFLMAEAKKMKFLKRLKIRKKMESQKSAIFA